MLLAERVKENCSPSAACDFWRIQRIGRKRRFARASQAFGQRSGASIVGDLQSFVCFAPRHERVDVVFINARGIAEKRQSAVYALVETAAGRLKCAQRGSILAVG